MNWLKCNFVLPLFTGMSLCFLIPLFFIFTGFSKYDDAVLNKAKPYMNYTKETFGKFFKNKKDWIIVCGQIDKETCYGYGTGNFEKCWNPKIQIKRTIKGREEYAIGLGQFTRLTVNGKVRYDLVEELKQRDIFLKRNDVFDYHWQIYAVIFLDASRYKYYSFAATEDDRWGFTLSSYNGGSLSSDIKLAGLNGYDTTKWFDCVEKFSNRDKTFFNINRGYVRQIFDRKEKYRIFD